MPDGEQLGFIAVTANLWDGERFQLPKRCPVPVPPAGEKAVKFLQVVEPLGIVQLLEPAAVAAIPV
jgi:hypothetical protein|eukprot:4834982-Prymnesium_polylepis.1